MSTTEYRDDEKGIFVEVGVDLNVAAKTNLIYQLAIIFVYLLS